MFETAETSRPHYTFAYWWSSATTALVTVAHKSNKMKRSISIPRPRKQPRRVINTTVDDTDSVSCSSLSSSCDDGNDHAEEPHPPPPRQQQMRQRLSASSLRQNEHTHHLYQTVKGGTAALSSTLGQNRLLTLITTALALTIFTTHQTFHSHRIRLTKMGLNQIRNQPHNLPQREFTSPANGRNFTIPRGVPLPPPLMMGLCAAHLDEGGCVGSQRADCVWCGTMGCVPMEFSKDVCKL